MNLNRFEVGTISIMTVDYSFTRQLNDFYLRYTEVRCVPDAEVSLHLVNVGFGGVIYRGVTELKASYIERGPTHSSHRAKIEILASSSGR